MKKIKDTKVGKWLGDKAPDIADSVANLLPDKGVLGFVKDLVFGRSNISDSDKIEFMRLQTELEIELSRETTKKIQSFNELEGVQLSQEDLYTKRARPTRQYFWLFLCLCMLVADLTLAEPFFININNPLFYVMAADMGIYTWNRTREKINGK